MPRTRTLTDLPSREETSRRLLVLAPLLAIACSPSPAPTTADEGAIRSTSPTAGRTTPEATSPEIPANPSCGKEVDVHGQGYDAAARECLWKAYQSSQPAELVITVHTIEGDPITTALRVRSPSAIDVVRDSKDRFGSPGVTRSTCTSMQRKQDDRGRTIFSLAGCSGPQPELTIP
jgi:hypothetical protein